MAAGQGRSDEMAELLELPLHDQGGGEPRPSSSESSSSRTSTAKADWGSRLGLLALDLVASVVFWYGLSMLDVVLATDLQFYCFLGVLLATMIAYRVYRAKTSPDECGVAIPYTCGYVPNSDKELFLVATIHISPRAPKDVEAVIDATLPDITMIELDDERLDRMRDVEVEQPQEPRPEDLQAISVTEAGGKSSTIYAQRALWNAEWSGEQISGDIVFDEANAHGLGDSGDAFRGKLALVHRGSPNGEFAPFALKAHRAAAAGAKAVLVINQPGKLPVNRIGGGTLAGDLRVAFSTCSCGFPPIPVLLLPGDEGERLAQLCKVGGGGGEGQVHAEMKVMLDEYPRRTLRRRLCQSCALIFSGIGILYGIIQCFDVEVGAEFLAAEIAATAKGIPCTCIDVDLNRFWSRLGMAVLPTPCNLLQSLLSWLAFPRVCCRVLFPPRGNVDVLGSMVLHAASFPCRTWVAFIIAGTCASFITSHILELFGFGVEQAGEGTGYVAKEDRDAVQALIMCAVEMYLLPQVYDAVAASRDEAMYQSIVEKGRHARRLVVVVGAGHANGILQRARTQGL